MKEEMQSEVARFVANINDALESGAEFTLEQAPLVAQEIVFCGRVYWTAYIAVLAITCLLSITGATIFAQRAARLFRKNVALAASENRDTKPSEDVGVGVWAGLATLLAMPFVIAFCECLQAIKPCLLAWCAPRLFVIDYLANLL